MRALLAFAGVAGLAFAANAGTLYFSDLETNDGGWIETGFGDWEWGTPTVGPATAFSGENVWGTVLGDLHSNSGADNTLSQTFDFTGWSNMTLSFYEWLNSGSNAFDKATVRVNGDELYLADGGPTADWRNVTLDLSAYDGLSSVEVVFNFFETTVVNREGWYIDDIALNGVPAPGALALLGLGFVARRRR